MPPILLPAPPAGAGTARGAKIALRGWRVTSNLLVMAFPEALLAEGEQTLLVTSPHGSEVLAPLVWLLAVIPCGGALVAFAGSEAAGPLAAMTTVVGVGTLLLVVFRTLHWQFTLYAVTNHRVIVRQGMLSRDNRDVPLSVIQDVRIQQGVIARAFKAGDLQLQSAAVRGHTTLRWLPQVHDVRRLLHHLVQTNPRPEGPPVAAPAAAPVPVPVPAPPPAPVPLSVPDLVGQLQRLSELRTAGHLTEAEFEAAKRRLLGGEAEPGGTNQPAG